METTIAEPLTGLQHVSQLVERAQQLLGSLTSLQSELCELSQRREASARLPSDEAYQANSNDSTRQNWKVQSLVQDLSLLAQETVQFSASYLPTHPTNDDGVDEVHGFKENAKTALSNASEHDFRSQGSSHVPLSINVAAPTDVNLSEKQAMEPLTPVSVATETNFNLFADERRFRTKLPCSSRPNDSVGLEPNESERPAKRKKPVPMDENQDFGPITRDVEKLVSNLRYYDKLCQIPTFLVTNAPSSLMLRRVAGVQGGPAIRQFCSLIRSRRERETELGLLHIHSQGIERALELSRSLGTITGRFTFGTFLTRLVQYHIALAIDQTLVGRLRADSDKIKETMDKFGWNDTERPRFFQYLRQGRQWKLICGEYPGLLCLIPLKSEKPYSLSATDYTHMKGQELEAFAQLIHSPFMAQLNQSCQAFQDMVLGNRDDGEFKWEKDHPELHIWDRSLAKDHLASLLQPFPHEEQPVYESTMFQSAPRPPGWPGQWPWPCNPLRAWDPQPGNYAQCELCEEPACSCLTTTLGARKPRIKSYEKLGIGLQAVAAHEGELAYAKGDVIGQFGGRLLPAGTYAHDGLYVMDMRRPDISGAPIVCQIYAGEIGNCYRNLNHCCRASAQMRPIRVSGVWVLGIEAIRDMRHGEQITVNFGKRFLRKQGLRCECESCQGK